MSLRHSYLGPLRHAPIGFRLMPPDQSTEPVRMPDFNDFEPVAGLNQISDEGVLGVVKSNGERVCLIRHRHRITAIANNCTHQDFEMALGDVLPDGTIQCAWHGARFDCATGAVKQGPATEAITVYEVRVEGGRVLVGRGNKP